MTCPIPLVASKRGAPGEKMETKVPCAKPMFDFYSLGCLEEFVEDPWAPRTMAESQVELRSWI